MSLYQIFICLTIYKNLLINLKYLSTNCKDRKNVVLIVKIYTDHVII